jgi:hypothetical protein
MSIQERKQQIREEQSQREHIFFCNLAAALADGKLTPEHACSMIEVLRGHNIFADTMDKSEKQTGFNEIAAMYADYKITKEEACEVFVEWIDEWKNRA